VGYMLSPFLLLPLLNVQWRLPFLVCGLLGVASSLWLHVGVANHTALSKENPKISATPISTSATSSRFSMYDSYIEWFMDGVYRLSVAVWIEISLLLLANTLTYFTLKGMHEWTGLYLMEKHHVSVALSMELMLWNEVQIIEY